MRSRCASHGRVLQGRGPSRRLDGPRRGLMLLLLLIAWVQPGVAQEGGAAELVSIRGGADATGQQYRWTVTNHHSAPIVLVVLPHYRAAYCIGPSGWSTEESTYLVNVGVKDRPGECIARAGSPGQGIAAGGSAEFSMSLTAGGALRGQGTVRVAFADGTEIEVAGVELPQPEPAGDKFVPLIGLGAIFAFWLIWQAGRARRLARAGPTPGADRGDTG